MDKHECGVVPLGHYLFYLWLQSLTVLEFKG